jgi:hypothetical protein
MISLNTFTAGASRSVGCSSKSCPYPTYLNECLRIVRTGGAIMVDNAFA